MTNSKTLHQFLWWSKHPVALLWRIAGSVYRRFRPMEPWISFKAIAFFNNNLSKNMSGLEWGSGRSTIWFAARLGKLTSVEHNKEWHQYVSEQIKINSLSNVDYRMIPLNHPVEAPTPAHYDITPDYVKIASELQDQSLDFVLIDGHYRQACVTAALPKLKKGGYLTIDNSNWMPQSEWGVPATWPMIHKSTGFESETTIWQKP